MESITKRSHFHVFPLVEASNGPHAILPSSRQLPGSFEGVLEARNLFGPNVPRGGVGVPGHQLGRANLTREPGNREILHQDSLWMRWKHVEIFDFQVEAEFVHRMFSVHVSSKHPSRDPRTKELRDAEVAGRFHAR